MFDFLDPFLVIIKLKVCQQPLEYHSYYYQNFAAIVKETSAKWPEKARRLSVHSTLPKDSIKDITKLHKLRHLLVYNYRTKVRSYAHSKCGFKALHEIGNLHSLQKLCFMEVDQCCSTIIKQLEGLTQLRKLGIMKLREEDGHLHELPMWIPSLHSLVKLILRWSNLKHDPLVYLQDLPNLAHLELLQTGKRGGGCNALLGKANHPALRTAKEYGRGEDYWKVAHIPEVYFTYWRDGAWDVYALESFKESSARSGIVMRSHEHRNLRKF
ncbi:hypothetical protein K1719_045773 [Acacia pycnantha]|nr:hypothetical protein K1719_045773 [Acacia pycnantha]